MGKTPNEPTPTPPEDPSEDPWWIRMERWAVGVLRGSFAAGSIFSVPAFVVGGALERTLVLVGEVLGRLRPTDPFRLRRNGDSLFTRTVGLDLAVFSIFIGFGLCYDLFAWTSLWSYVAEISEKGAWGFVQSVILATLPLAFAGTIALLERGVAVMDETDGKRQWAVMTMRVLGLVVLSFVTAVPVELMVFRPEINARIEAIEKVQADAIRENAKTYEVNRAAELAKGTVAAMASQPESVEERRGRERDAFVEGKRAERAEIVSRLAGTGERVVKEAAGRGVSRGGRFRDETATALRRQEAGVRQELKDFDEAYAAQLAAFDAETERMRSEAAQAGLDEAARREGVLATKLREIELMPGTQLAAAYGGAYGHPRGFLARYRTLLDVVANDQQSQLVVWGCRILSMVMSLSILFAKFGLGSDETRAYLSLRAQAVAGNDGAIRTVAARALSGDRASIETLKAVGTKHPVSADALARLGYTNLEGVALAQEVSDLRSRHERAGKEVRAKHEQFEAAFRRLCETRPPYARRALENAAITVWVRDVQPAVDDFLEADSACEKAGIRPPRWPTDARVSDPRLLWKKPWELADKDLVERYGWTTPEFERNSRSPIS